MNKRNIFSILAIGLIVMLASNCAKTEKSELNASNKRYFDAWMQENHPDLKPSELGVFIENEVAGKGESIGDAEDNPYLFVTYTIRDLNQNITATTDKKIAQQIGSYKETNYYGPIVWTRFNHSMQAGVAEAIKGMKDGGERTVIIPGWLATYKRYETEQDFLNNVKGTNAIYTIKIHSHTDDYEKWEADSLKRYSAKYLGGIDTLSKGFYYKQVQKPSTDKEFPKDTTFYVNYIGRLLNGQVFDTNMADLAKIHKIYSSSKSYKPAKITKGEKFQDIKMGESSVIPGFAKALQEMKPGEKCITVFASNLGYGTKNQGSSIPSFAMLRFDIEVVENKE